MFADRTALTTRAYADHAPLAARLSIYDWQVDRVDLPGLALAELAGTRGVVLDAGCGLGTYTNGRDDKPEIAALWSGAVADLTGTRVEPPSGADRFTLDDAHLLRAAWDTVEVHTFDRETLVPEVEPVVAYVESTRALWEHALPAGLAWNTLLVRVRERVTAEVERRGVFRIVSQVGYLRCG